jgi:hypothetical protein
LLDEFFKNPSCLRRLFCRGHTEIKDFRIANKQKISCENYVNVSYETRLAKALKLILIVAVIAKIADAECVQSKSYQQYWACLDYSNLTGDY